MAGNDKIPKSHPGYIKRYCLHVIFRGAFFSDKGLSGLDTTTIGACPGLSDCLATPRHLDGFAERFATDPYACSHVKH